MLVTALTPRIATTRPQNRQGGARPWHHIARGGDQARIFISGKEFDRLVQPAHDAARRVIASLRRAAATQGAATPNRILATHPCIFLKAKLIRARNNAFVFPCYSVFCTNKAGCTPSIFVTHPIVTRWIDHSTLFIHANILRTYS